MPALIYLIFSFSHVVIDTYKGLYNTAIIEIWISAVFTLVLNLLCMQNLGIIAWLIISIPFILMTVIATLLLFMFNLNPATGKALTQPAPTQTTQTSQSTSQPPQSTQPTQTAQPAPILKSSYAFPVSTFYGSLGNYTPPVAT